VFVTQVFNELEAPAEMSLLNDLQSSVLKERQFLIHTIVNQSVINSEYDHGDRLRNLTSFVSHKLGDYEKVVQEAVRGGVSLPLDPVNPAPQASRWNFVQAVFFASTVLTTIGMYKQVVRCPEIVYRVQVAHFPTSELHECPSVCSFVHLHPGWTTLSPNSPHHVKTKKLGCSTENKNTVSALYFKTYRGKGFFL
jgi:hypothetical protein